MKRLFLIAAAGVGAAWAAAAPGLAAPPPRAALSGFVCQTSQDALSREVSVTAVMRPQLATQRMQIRFQLFERPGGSRSWRQVHGGDLGTWRHPSPPTLGQEPGDKWQQIKQVADLVAPALYRFRVTFRWEVSGGQVLSVLWSLRCSES